MSECSGRSPRQAGNGLGHHDAKPVTERQRLRLTSRACQPTGAHEFSRANSVSVSISNGDTQREHIEAELASNSNAHQLDRHTQREHIEAEATGER